MIYVIDHNDSFTYNVVHQFSLFDEVECDNYNEINVIKLQKAKVLVFFTVPAIGLVNILVPFFVIKFSGEQLIIE